MADKQPEWIEPVVALRMLVRAAVPKRPAFANHVTGPFWYWYTKDIGQTCEATEDEIKAVQGVDPFLHASLRNGRIQSRGVFNGEGASVPIDELEYTLNNLDLWNRRLDCSTSRRSKRVFENVHLNRENVETAKDELIAMYRSGGAALEKNLKKNLEKAYRNHVKASKADRNWTTIKQDQDWANDGNVGRTRMWQLRKNARREMLDYEKARKGGPLAAKHEGERNYPKMLPV